MENLAHDLFLLTTNLTQLQSKDLVIKIFIESVNSIFLHRHFIWHSDNTSSGNDIQVCTRSKTYGFIQFDNKPGLDAESYGMVQNAIQILAVVLEKLEHDHLLADEKLHLQKLVDEKINAIKENEEALRESEEIFNKFMEHSPIYVFFKDENIRAIRLSKNFESMLGKPIKELLGKNMEELFPSKLAKSMVEDDMKILKEGREITVDEEFNGRSYTTIKFPIQIDEKTSYLAGYAIDITERKKAEEALRVSEAKFRPTFELSPVGIVIVGLDKRFIRCNNAFLQSLGYQEENLLGKTIADITFPDDRHLGMEAMMAMVNGELDTSKIQKR